MPTQFISLYGAGAGNAHSHTTFAPALDLLVFASKEAVQRLWVVNIDRLAELRPKLFMLFNRAGEEEIVDIDRQEQLDVFEPKTGRMILDRFATHSQN